MLIVNFIVLLFTLWAVVIIRLVITIMRRDRVSIGPAEVLLILGGSQERERVIACQIPAHLPNLKAVLLSSGSTGPSELHAAVRSSGTTLPVLCDHSAVDTVSNFTTTLPALMASGVRHVAVATSVQHSRRAETIAFLALSVGNGLQYSIHTVDCPDEPAESLARCLRDAARALAWISTGLDGTSLARRVHPRRALDADAAAASGRLAPLPLRLAEALRCGVSPVSG